MPPKYRVGQQVRVRSYRKMRSLWNARPSGDIPIHGIHYTPEMDRLAGKDLTYTISDIAMKIQLRGSRLKYYMYSFKPKKTHTPGLGIWSYSIVEEFIEPLHTLDAKDIPNGIHSEFNTKDI